MSNLPSCSTSKQNDGFEEDEIFDDSSFLAKFDSSFKQTSKFFEDNINDSLDKSALNVSALCCDEEIKGYDKLTGKTWIYPTNYPVRDYQFNIIRSAIVQNTLVSLPTGLGKTFIAAVIMYNFYRWYPLGKIVFTAPTRPLVAQQIEACYNIIGIPPNDTIEMTGHMQVNTRKLHWANKRVFFATPQVIYNDMKSGICPCDKVRCLVIDEAHRARGNYAYCQIIATMDDGGHKTYRVLALSATPGSKVEDVVNVVKTLHIAHLELRTENCIDVAPYSHARKINTVVIELGPQLTQLRQQYIEILDGYARRLKQLNIMPPNLGNLSKGRIVMLYKEYQNRERSARHPQHNYIMKDFTVLISLYHGMELLAQHGARVFLNFFDEHPEKSWIQADDRLTALLERLRDDLGVNPLSLDRSMLPDGTVPEIPKDLCFGHPKFDKLKDIMLRHFKMAEQNKQDTRAIVFCEYRESVNLVHCLLLQCRPLIKPQMFVGQGASGKDGKTVVSQKQQLRVMRSFREGVCNVLVATCVAEEGLDVGSVDLIVCFDISTKSPVRLVQRCGRTGRERGGQVFILVTEGREHQTLMDCMRQRDGLNKKILQSKEVQNNLYKNNPRMMPRDFMPTCQKMYITVEKKPDKKDKKDGKEGIEKAKKGQKDLRAMLLGRASTSNATLTSSDMNQGNIISEREYKEIYPDGYRGKALFAEPREYWAMNKHTIQNHPTVKTDQLNLCKWLEWQRTLQKTVNIHHSKDTEILSELLQYCDAKRFEMPPSTQNPTFSTQESQPPIFMSPAKSKPASSPAKINKQPKKKAKLPIIRSPGKKDGDIRALFSTATKSTKNYTKLINDLGIQNDGSISTKLISLLVDLSLDNTNIVKTCYICENICECKLIQDIKKEKKIPSVVISLKELRLPDIDLIDEFDKDTVMKCSKVADDSQIDEREINIKSKNVNNFDIDADFLFDEDDEIKFPIKEEVNVINNNKNDIAGDQFDLGDIADIFANSSPEEAIEKELIEKQDVEIERTVTIKNDKIMNVEVEKLQGNDVKVEGTEDKAALGFFGLDSIDDIFADDEIEDTPPEIVESKPDSNKNITNLNCAVSPTLENPTSPSILSGITKPKESPTSPILCSQARKFSLSIKKDKPHSSTPNTSCRKKLIGETTNNNVNMPDENHQSTFKNSVINSSKNKSMFTITQLVEMINKTDNNTSTLKKSDELEREERSNSPILLTQADKRKSSLVFNDAKKQIATTSNVKKNPVMNNTSLIILDSDSDSDGTQIYDAKEEINNTNAITKTSDNNTLLSPINNKRKSMDDSDSITASPYFNKKPKLDNDRKKELTIQEKILAALTSNKIGTNFKNNSTAMNCLVSQPSFVSQKENRNPNSSPELQPKDHSPMKNKLNGDNSTKNNNLSMLQMFRRDSKVNSVKSNTIFNSRPAKNGNPTITFDDSDDDFISDEKNNYRSQHALNSSRSKTTTNHKVRKKKKKTNNEFLDMEAQLSEDDDNSGDELSDDSIGSIVDFICDDDNVTHHVDMQAMYLKSIKSPVNVKGGFKIPELPKKYNKEDVLSQFVEEDSYQMDSFCVDSHIGLTQANDVSELELAEMLLEEKRRAKKKKIYSQDESPEVKKKHKPKRLQIDSDSEDSS